MSEWDRPSFFGGLLEWDFGPGNFLEKRGGAG
jgi:hypothetical protein